MGHKWADITSCLNPVWWDIIQEAWYREKTNTSEQKNKQKKRTKINKKTNNKTNNKNVELIYAGLMLCF